MSVWDTSDPRETFDKHGSVIISRPDPDKVGYSQLSYAWVETDEVYCIFIDSFKDHSYLSADDKWDPCWKWVIVPEDK